MNLDSSLLTRYSKPPALLVLLLTFGMLFLSGLVQAYHAHLATMAQLSATRRLARLSAPAWIIYRAGPFLIDPVLLFGVLYYARTRLTPTCSLTDLLPGLAVAVLAGSLLGQFVGVRLWPPAPDLPLFALFSPGFYALHYYALHWWLVLITPLVYDLLVVVSALAFAETKELKA